MEHAIAAVRAFNRFYTRLIGALDEGFLGTGITLAEARLLFELATREPVVATVVQEALGMDAGHASRVLRRFEQRGWIIRARHADDGRARPIRLTAAGREAFDALDRSQRDAVAAMIGALAPVERDDLMATLARARLLLAPGSAAAVTVRPFRVGDASFIAARQSILYDASHGWGRGAETVEAEVVAAFLRGFDEAREGGWIAELDGATAGSVLLTDEGAGLARLRLLYVEPFARRRGIGDALVAACLRFARDTGYAAITLWTHTVLEDARRIYARHGFRIVATEVHDTFGAPLQGETWRLELVASP